MTNFHTRKTYEEPGLVTAVGGHETDDLGLHFVLDGTSLIIQVAVTTSIGGERGIEESENLAERIVAAVRSWVDDAPNPLDAHFGDVLNQVEGLTIKGDGE